MIKKIILETDKPQLVFNKLMEEMYGTDISNKKEINIHVNLNKLERITREQFAIYAVPFDKIKTTDLLTCFCQTRKIELEII